MVSAVAEKETVFSMSAPATSEGPTTGREWHLTARPKGWPTPDDFALREAPVPAPGPGQLVVRNLFLSVDPYMRGPDERRQVLRAAVPRSTSRWTAARSARSSPRRRTGIAVGDHVLHGLGWREYAVLDAAQATKVDPAAAPLSAYLGVLGMTGLTAYAGLLRDRRRSRRATRSSSPARRARSAARSARSPGSRAPPG